MEKIGIIGSGIGAYSIVSSIIELGIDAEITVFELGSNSHSDAILFQDDDFDTDQFRSKVKLWPTHSVQIGGTSQLWHGVLGWHDNVDFTDSSSIFESYSDYLGYCEKIINRFTKLPFAINDLEKNEELFSFSDYFSDYLSPKPFLVLRRPIRVKSELKKFGVKVLHNTEVSEIFNSDSKVLISCRGMKERFVFSKVFICAGNFGSPKLVSRIIKKSLKLDFFDHPMGVIGTLMLNRYHKSEFHEEKHYSNRLNIKYGFTVRYQQKGKNFNIYFRPAFSSKSVQDTENLKLRLLGYRSGNMFNISAMLNLISNIPLLLQVLSYKFLLKFPYKLYEVYVINDHDNLFGELSINDSGSITDVMYPYSNESFKEITTILTSIFGKRFSLNENFNFSSAAHLSGSLVNSKLLDKNNELLQINNVYICDSSVLPFSGNVNSSLTLMAIGKKMIDNLYATNTSVR